MPIDGLDVVPIDLTGVPGARLAFNGLCDSRDPQCLLDDLVLVELPGDLFVDVGWHPECETPGAYHVTVFRSNDWEHPVETAEADSAQAAAGLVVELARRHGRSSTLPRSTSRRTRCGAIDTPQGAGD